MPGVLISCPQCGKGLKLRDRNLLGRPGRCPACRHKFVLQEPEEVELELAESAPAVGTGAKWIPDDPPFPGREIAASHDPPRFPPSTPADAADGLAGIPLLTETAESPAGGTLQKLRQRRARHRRTSIVLGGIVGTAIAAVVLVVVFARPLEPPPARPQNPRRTESVQYAAQQATLRDNLALAREASPTDGEPIRLMYVPTGANVIVHLRPAELWSDEPAAQEFRACLGEPLVPAVAAWIKMFCRFEPRELEELLVCFILPQQGHPPQVSAVIRTIEPQPRSQLLERFPGDLNQDHGYPLYVAEQQIYLFSEDRHTIAIAPNEPAVRAEVAESMLRKQPATTKDGIVDLLEHTDRKRHITLVFEPRDVRLHQQFLVPEKARQAVESILDWFGDDVETVAWSIHRGDGRFFSQLHLRDQHVWTPTQLQAEMRQKLERLPRELLEAVQKMDPPTAGARMLIGRFPAMVKVFALKTLFAIPADRRKDGYVQMTTVLPERAAPNLALAALLTWDESTRTDFSQAAPTQPTGPKLPDTVVERLQKSIEIDFNREPLEPAFQYIGRETGVAVEVDGKALESGGMTRNMPQTQILGTVPAIDGIAAILARYEQEGLCIVIDEPRKAIILTTKSAAEKRGQTPHPVGGG